MASTVAIARRATSLTAWAVPRNRRPKFELVLKILDLNNVPLVSGTSLIKWHLPHSAAAEHRGRTAKCSISDHKVEYNYEKVVPIRLTVDKNGALQDTAIHFEVIQEYASGRGERINLGNIRLNLAEYVDASENEEGEEEGVVRRYLMQDSKVNSTLKISITMRLIEGDRTFTAPALKTAPVFGGIAGIIAGEQGDADEQGVGHMTSLSSKSREAGEAQDMYRRTLAAYWDAQPGELHADECVEDIFAGGDGWSKHHKHEHNHHGHHHHQHSRHGSLTTAETSPSMYNTESDTKAKNSSNRSHSPDQKGSSSDSSTKPSTQRTGPFESTSSSKGRASLEQHAHKLKESTKSLKSSSTTADWDEMDLREDLRSWNLPGVST